METHDRAVELFKSFNKGYRWLYDRHIIVCVDVIASVMAVYLMFNQKMVLGLLLFIAFAPTVEDFIKYFKRLRSANSILLNYRTDKTG